MFAALDKKKISVCDSRHKIIIIIIYTTSLEIKPVIFIVVPLNYSLLFTDIFMIKFEPFHVEFLKTLKHKMKDDSFSNIKPKPTFFLGF